MTTKGRPGRALEPVVIDTIGRGGSTAVMRLLRSSPEVVVEGPYPYERRYYRYLRLWAETIDGDGWSTDLWGQEELATALGPGRRQRGLVGPPPWRPREHLAAAEGEPPMGERCFELAWAEFSRRARRAHGGGAARLYAEKFADVWATGAESLAPARVGVLVRDPRDTFASIDAFNAKRGRRGFGRERFPDEREYLDFFIERHRARLRWILALPSDGTVPVLRYEELIADPDRFAGRLEEWLGIQLDVGSLRADADEVAVHATAPDAAGSVGRWRRDLDRRTADELWTTLAGELEALGYAR